MNNFVTFRDFYARKTKAVFQAGTLYLDGRSCDLCLKVADAAKHSALAGLSNTYLAYCDCARPGGSEKMGIVAAFTGGDSDFLMVGRNGVFYDRLGRDWDATVTKIVDHPISIRQAFWAPYKKLARFVGEQVAKFAASKEKSAQDAATASVGDAARKAEAAGAKPPAKGEAPAGAPPPVDMGKFAGIFAAIGLALGAIGSAIAAVVTGFLKLPWWQMPLAVAGIVLAVSGPSVVLAWLKLRQRNLGPILEASGWAINARARINIPFGSALTSVARLPAGAERSLDDPYAEKSRVWLFVLLVAAPLAGGVLYWAWKKGGLFR